MVILTNGETCQLDLMHPSESYLTRAVDFVGRHPSILLSPVSWIILMKAESISALIKNLKNAIPSHKTYE